MEGCVAYILQINVVLEKLDISFFLSLFYFSYYFFDEVRKILGTVLCFGIVLSYLLIKVCYRFFFYLNFSYIVLFKWVMEYMYC